MNRRFSVILVFSIVLQAPLSAQSAPPPATEASAGFDTPTLVQKPGSKSFSNGIAELPGDTFVLDQQIYETLHDVNTGLGPVYNGRACAECHQNPVSGGASQFTELRIGHRDENGTFVNPTVPINDGADRIGSSAGLSSTTGLSFRRRRSTYRLRRTSGHCARRSAH
jgi:hypothetical protein